MTEARPPHAGQETNSPYEFNANGTYNEVIYSENWKRLRSKEYFDYRHDWGRDTARETRDRLPNSPRHRDDQHLRSLMSDVPVHDPDRPGGVFRSAASRSRTSPGLLTRVQRMACEASR